MAKHSQMIRQVVKELIWKKKMKENGKRINEIVQFTSKRPGLTLTQSSCATWHHHQHIRCATFQLQFQKSGLAHGAKLSGFVVAILPCSRIVATTFVI